MRNKDFKNKKTAVCSPCQAGSPASQNFLAKIIQVV
jgi:hypothetical protein